MKGLLKREPVRAAVYSVVAAAVALGVALGYIDDGLSATVTGVAALLFGITTEAARSVVTPVAKMNREQNLS